MQRSDIFYSHIAVKVLIKEKSWLATIAAKKLRVNNVAMVIGTTIHLHKVSREEFLADKEWLCHELMHVNQYKKYGTPRFLFFYLVESIKKGYYNNRFEKEARAAEKDRSLLHKFQVV